MSFELGMLIGFGIGLLGGGLVLAFALVPVFSDLKKKKRK